MAKRANTKKAAKSPKRTTRKAASSRKVISVNDIRNRFKDMDASVRGFLHKNNLNNPKELGKHVSRQWAKMFNKHLSSKATASLTNHYISLHGKKGTKKGMRGGMAPLDYVMRPGMPGVATYATFPTEVGADPKSVQDLDVYYNSGIGRSCGTENTTAHVPATMGSNKVGGSRRRKTRRVRGGDFMAALGTRQFVASNPAGSFQQMGESWYGQAPSPYDAKDPSVSAFKLVSDGKLPIDPSGISIIDKDMTKMANPSPYPAVR
jgi:hypothetical protein